LISKDYKTLPSCEGHVLSKGEAKLTLEKLLEDERKIKGDGLELVNTEDDEDVIIFKNTNYKVPFQNPSEIIQEKYSGYVGVEIPDKNLLKSIYNELASVDEHVQVDVDGDRLDIYVETDSQKRQKDLWKEITEIVKTEISDIKKYASNESGSKILYHCGSKLPDEPWSLHYSGTGERNILPLGPGIYFHDIMNIANLYCKYSKEPYLYKVEIDSETFNNSLYNPVFGTPLHLRESFSNFQNDIKRIPEYSNIDNWKIDIDFIFKIFGKIKAIEELNKIGIKGLISDVASGFEVSIYDPSIIKTLEYEKVDKKEARLNEIEYFYKIAGNPRFGTGKKPKGSSRRLYTDENPKDTVPVKFRTVSDIRKTLSRSDFKSKSHKRQSQIINLIHQRVRAAYQNAKDAETKARLKKALQYAESKKEQSKKKTKRLQRKASINYLHKTAAHPQTRNLSNKRLPPFFRKNLDYGERESFIKKRLEDSAKDYNAPRTGKGKKRWSVKYKKKINCSNPKGFSQKQYCKRKRSGGKYKSSKLEDIYSIIKKYSNQSSEQTWVYHTTFLKNIDSIAENGLILGSKSQFGSGYDFNTSGKIFFSDINGIGYWMNKLKGLAQYNEGAPEDGWIPVCLRIPEELVSLEEDSPGKHDSYSSAFYTRASIPPDAIEIWDGQEWISVASADIESMIETILMASNFIIDWSDGTSERLDYERWYNEGWNEGEASYEHEESEEGEESKHVEAAYWNINYSYFKPK
jgi:hypothetical protein